MEDKHVRILLEDINHKFQIINENTAHLPERMGNIEKDVHQIKEDIVVIKVSLKNKANIERVEKIEADIKVLQQKIV